MNLLTNPRFTGPAILLLLLLNATLLVFLLFKKEPLPPPPGPPDGPRLFLVRELKLDADQQQQFEQLVREHRRSVGRLQEHIHQLRDSLVETLRQPQTSPAVTDRLTQAIGSDQAAMEKATMEHFARLRAICRPEQQQRFDEIIRETLNRMGPPPPPRDRKIED